MVIMAKMANVVIILKKIGATPTPMFVIFR